MGDGDDDDDAIQYDAQGSPYIDVTRIPGYDDALWEAWTATLFKPTEDEEAAIATEMQTYAASPLDTSARTRLTRGQMSSALQDEFDRRDEEEAAERDRYVQDAHFGE